MRTRLQAYVGRSVAFLDAVAHLAAALREARSLLPARTLVVHTQYWGLALGQDATQYQSALESAMRTAASLDICTATYLPTSTMTRSLPAGAILAA